MASLTSTTITTPSFLDTTPQSVEKRDVQTDLTYWKPQESNSVAVDVASPGVEERLNDLTKLNSTHKVLIHDVRGEESKYTLHRNGFQYVHHHVEEVKDWSNEEHVTEVLLPATEQLVKQM